MNGAELNGNNLKVADNSALTRASFASMTTIGHDLTIERNPAFQNFQAPLVNSVVGRARVTDNPQLCESINDFIAQLSPPPTDSDLSGTCGDP